MKVGLLNLPVLQRDLTLQRCAQPVDHRPLELRLDRVRIDDRANIGGNHDPVHAGSAVNDRYLCNLRDIRAKRFDHRDPTGAAPGHWLPPAGFLSGQFEYGLMTRMSR